VSGEPAPPPGLNLSQDDCATLAFLSQRNGQFIGGGKLGKEAHVPSQPPGTEAGEDPIFVQWSQLSIPVMGTGAQLGPPASLSG
jgi:hypothetical protein